jgi:hypothetical protein
LAIFHLESRWNVENDAQEEIRKGDEGNKEVELIVDIHRNAENN